MPLLIEQANEHGTHGLLTRPKNFHGYLRVPTSPQDQGNLAPSNVVIDLPWLLIAPCMQIEGAGRPG